METVVGSMLTYSLCGSTRVLGTTPILYSETASQGDLTRPIYVEYDRYPEIMQPSFSGEDIFRDFTLTRNANTFLHFNAFSTFAETWTCILAIEKRAW